MLKLMGKPTAAGIMLVLLLIIPCSSVRATGSYGMGYENLPKNIGSCCLGCISPVSWYRGLYRLFGFHEKAVRASGQRFLLLKDSLWYYKSGEIAFGSTSKAMDFTFRGNRYTALGVSFHKNGSIKTLWSNIFQNPIRYDLYGKKMTIDGTGFTFYPDGKIKSFHLREFSTFTPAGMEFNAPKLRAWPGIVYLHENGTVMAMILYGRHDLFISGRLQKGIPNRGVIFNRDGSVFALFGYAGKKYNDYIDHFHIGRDLGTDEAQGEPEGLFWTVFKDYEKGTVDAVSLPFKRLPEGVKIVREELEVSFHYSDSKYKISDKNDIHLFWVKYDEYRAGDIRSILFIEDTEITFHGKLLSCKAFEWIPLQK